MVAQFESRWDVTDDDWHDTLDVNLSSVFYCCREAIPIMKSRGGGRIINVSSIAARNGGGGGSVHYATAKGAVTTFTKGLARELAPFGILVNAINPGLMLTRFHIENTPPERIERVRQQTPVGRVGQADDVVGAVLFLLSDSLPNRLPTRLSVESASAAMPDALAGGRRCPVR